jgi:hypothetical protein
MTAHNTIAVCQAAIARIPAGDAAGGAKLLASPLRHYSRDPSLLYVAGNCSLALGNQDLSDRRRLVFRNGSPVGRYALSRDRHAFGNRLKRSGGFQILKASPLVRVQPGVLF